MRLVKAALVEASQVTALAALCGLTAWVGLTFTRTDGAIAAIWLPNGLVLGSMLLAGHRRWVWSPWAAIGGFLASVICHIPWQAALALAVSNLLEVLVAYWLVSSGRPRNAIYNDVTSLTRFALLGGTVGPALSGIIGAAALGDARLGFDVAAWLNWWLTHTLGLILVVPCMLVIADVLQDTTSRQPMRVGPTALVLVPSTLAIAILFSQSRLPLLFLACPIVVVAAFRLRSFGTVATGLIISVVAIIAHLNATGPIQLSQGDSGTKLRVLQLFIFSNFIIGFSISAALASREKARAEAEESHKLAESILSNTRDVIFRTDVAGRWIFLNKAWEALSGYTVKSAIKKSSIRLLNREDVAAVVAHYHDMISGRSNEAHLVQRFISANGEQRYAESRFQALRDQDGTFIGTTGNIRDVTEQYIAQYALLESEQRFQTLADCSPAAIFCTNRDGVCTYVNKTWERLTGLSQTELKSANWTAVLDPGEQHRVASIWADAVNSATVFRSETFFQNTEGNVCWIDASASPDFSEEGVIREYIVVAIDITEKKIADALLLSRKAELRLLADHVSDALIRLDFQGVYKYASPSSLRVLGAKPDDLVGQNILQRVHPADTMPLNEGLARLQEDCEQSLVIPYRFEPHNSPGEWRWLEANIGAARSSSGRPSEVVASVRDITEHKELEYELNKAREKAEAGARAKSSFLANMSHEIRTPMNAVIGFAELLLGSDLTSEQQRHADLIVESGKAMMRLLNDILDLSKVEAGAIQLKPQVVNLANELDSCLNLMNALSSQKGLVMTCDIQPSVPTMIVVDGFRIRQVLLNLLGNAIKFTETGSVAVRAQLDTDASNVIIIEVRDTGSGVPLDRQTAIFGEFVQAHSTGKHHQGGSGLGLAISEKLARLMGGSLSLISEVGLGSCFSFRFQFEPAVGEGVIKPAKAAPLVPRVGTAISILLAEDHDINQILMEDMLTRLGHKVTIVPNGADALSSVLAAENDSVPFDLVLMDVQMPVMDGLSASRAIRAAKITADRLPIIALTADAFPEDVASCLEAGMQAHIAKPVSIDDLQIALKHWGNTLGEPVARRNILPPEVRKQYEIRRARVIGRLLELVASPAANFKGLDDLASELHKLAGTAGLFGETPLGNYAKRLEVKLESCTFEEFQEHVAAALNDLGITKA
jgi:PAS domain S-box-containing protein